MIRPIPFIFLEQLDHVDERVADSLRAVRVCGISVVCEEIRGRGNVHVERNLRIGECGVAPLRAKAVEGVVVELAK
ncbi:MAG: hypothetical protein ACLFNT_07085 [Spirochaetales bacterium]